MTPANSTPPVPVPTTAVLVLSALGSLLLPAVTVVGLIVLLALGKIEPVAGLALIAAIVGVHGGAAVARSS